MQQFKVKLIEQYALIGARNFSASVKLTETIISGNEYSWQIGSAHIIILYRVTVVVRKIEVRATDQQTIDIIGSQGQKLAKIRFHIFQQRPMCREKKTPQRTRRVNVQIML